MGKKPGSTKAEHWASSNVYIWSPEVDFCDHTILLQTSTPHHWWITHDRAETCLLKGKITAWFKYANSWGSDHPLRLCSVLAHCLADAVSAACPFQPICTTKPLCGNLFSSDLDKRHHVLLIFILSEYCFDHVFSSPSSSPPSVLHPMWAASPCFQSLSSFSWCQALPGARFCICCPFHISQLYAFVLARARIQLAIWANEVQETALLKCFDIWGWWGPRMPLLGCISRR